MRGRDKKPNNTNMNNDKKLDQEWPTSMSGLTDDPVARMIALGKEWLAHNCPAHPYRTAPHLIGYHGPVGYVCSHCSGRLSGGGHDLRLFCVTPLWGDRISKWDTSECTCQLCGRTLTNQPTN